VLLPLRLNVQGARVVSCMNLATHDLLRVVLRSDTIVTYYSGSSKPWLYHSRSALSFHPLDVLGRRIAKLPLVREGCMHATTASHAWVLETHRTVVRGVGRSPILELALLEPLVWKLVDSSPHLLAIVSLPFYWRDLDYT